MTEDFLHYIWKYRLINKTTLFSVEKEEIKIINQGVYNTDAGPDFFNARIKINDTIWAGNVEIHVKSSDWIKHNHQHDAKYDNVILHVVYEYDVPVKRKNNQVIPCLCLKNNFDEELFLRYKNLLANKNWVPCENNLKLLDKNISDIWMEKLIVERLQRKSAEIEQVLKANNNNWNHVFYLFLCKNFGFKVNSLAFEMLAHSLPFNILAKQSDSLFQTEALLFGQAGFLNQIFIDAYSLDLQKEYYFLRQKYSLKPINASVWKLMRIRPQNFPHIRIAQLAVLINKFSSLFSEIIENEFVNGMVQVFQNKTSEYWQTHYLFDKKSVRKNSVMGKSSVENIIINTAIPFLFAYGTVKKEPQYKERALDFLNAIETEKNNITEKWQKRGLKAITAADSQALIELKINFCDKKKCLQCMIGDYVLRKKNV